MPGITALRFDLPSREQLALLAAVSLDPAADASRLLTPGLDWAQLEQAALQQGVFPLFFRAVRALGEQVPPTAVKRCEGYAQALTHNNLRLAWKLVELAGLLNGAGIEFLVLKGPVMALQAYGDLALRPYTDLDILIRARDFARAYDLLLQSGYEPASKIDPMQRELWLRTDNHFPFTRQGDGIELHWDVAPRGNTHPLPPEFWWRDTARVEVLGQEVRTLSPENTILFTCLHGAKHAWRQLKWAADLAHLYRACQQLDWLALLERAKALGFHRQVCLGLILAEDLAGLALPAALRERARAEPGARALAEQARARLFFAGSPPGLLADYGFYRCSRERLSHRLFFLFDLFLAPKTPDWRTLELPARLYPLYYLFRPLRLLGLAVKAALAVLSGRKAG